MVNEAASHEQPAFRDQESAVRNKQPATRRERPAMKQQHSSFGFRISSFVFPASPSTLNQKKHGTNLRVRPVDESAKPIVSLD